MKTPSMPPLPSDFWYTPPFIIERVNAFLGADHFDPCPVNPQFDGLKEPWADRCYINPPYSKDLKRAFIRKAEAEFTPGRVFLWLVNYACSQDLLDLKSRASAVCLPHTRVNFIPGHRSLTGHPENPDPKKRRPAPMYDNILILWGPSHGFAENFAEIGSVFKCR